MASPFVAGNWKMNTTVEEAVALASALREPLSAISTVKSAVCPPFISLVEVKRTLEGTPIGLGAQNLYPEPKGAFTGEVSGSMLQGICQYVIVGHSERRHILGESDELVNRKVASALGFQLTPILCVGETLQEREAGAAEQVVQRQLREGLKGLSADDVGRVIIAYEPVWAIGTGRAATPEIAQEMMALVRRELAQLSSPAVAGGVPLLYGGSVNAGNAPALAAQPDIDGALVGGASLQAGEFTEIVKAFAQRK